MTAASDQVALLLVEDHISGCLTHAIETGQGKPYVDEVMTVVRRTLGRREPALSGPGHGTGVPQGGTTALPARAYTDGQGTARRPANRPRAALFPEHRELLSAALDERVEAEHRLEPVEPDAAAGGERVEVLPLQEVPVLALHLLAQPW